MLHTGAVQGAEIAQAGEELEEGGKNRGCRENRQSQKGEIVMKKILLMLCVVVLLINFNMTAYSEEPEDTCISETAQQACIEYGEQYGICPELLMAIIETESRGQADVIGGDCVGLMQINPKWHKDRMKRLGVTDLFDERSNILVGTDLLAELFEEYSEAAIVLGLYHGEKNAIKKAESGKMSSYAEGILERSTELERLHGK